MDDYEYAVFRRVSGATHRGPMTEQDAHEWIAEWIDWGGKPDVFYVMRRKISPWEDA